MKGTHDLCAVGALLALVAAVPATCQTESLATFTGTVQRIDSKTLTIEVQESNTLQFNCSRKTGYYDGDKKVDRSAVKPGERVSVDARQALDGSLDAINVRVEHRKARGSKPPS